MKKISSETTLLISAFLLGSWIWMLIISASQNSGAILIVPIVMIGISGFKAIESWRICKFHRKFFQKMVEEVEIKLEPNTNKKSCPPHTWKSLPQGGHSCTKCSKSPEVSK